MPNNNQSSKKKSINTKKQELPQQHSKFFCNPELLDSGTLNFTSKNMESISSPNDEFEALPEHLFPKENLSLILYGKHDLRLQTWPLPERLKADEVLLESHSTGICGTDLHLFNHGQVAQYKLTRPFCLGHEPSAVVLKCGKLVSHLKPGDRVAVEPAIPCLRCDRCRSGRYNLCPLSNQQSHGLPNSDGSLRRYYTHPADFCYKLPETISLEHGAIVEALAVVVHACRRLAIEPMDSVLVCGAGPVGILAMLTAKAFGCGRVCITDIKQHRLQLAKQMGADMCYWIDVNATQTITDQQRAIDIVRLFGEPDLSIECTGVESSQSMAIHCTKHGGRIAIVGLGAQYNRIPLATCTMKEIDLIGVCRIKDDYKLAISLMESGKININGLITHRFTIEQSLQAFKLLATQGTSDELVLKVLIQYL